MIEANFIGYLSHNLLDSRVPSIYKYLSGKKMKKTKKETLLGTSFVKTDTFQFQNVKT